MIDVVTASSDAPTARPMPLLFDGRGGASELDWRRLREPGPPERRIWIDLALPDPDAVALLGATSTLDQHALAALLADETRPRWLASGGGLLIILRGVNFNPGAEPDDMVSLRLWSEPGLVISTHRRDIRAVHETRAALLAGRGPSGVRDLIVGLCDHLVTKVRPLVEGLDDQAGEFEDWLFDGREDQELAADIARLRRTTIRLRRHLAPQRLVLNELAAADELAWLRDSDRRRLREIADRMTRELELLEAVREHALIAQDELQNRAIQRTARTSYLLTVVAALFLPLTFVTGLLGMNLGGIPGTADPWAFAAACAGLIALLVVELLLLRRLGWLRFALPRRPAARADDLSR